MSKAMRKAKKEEMEEVEMPNCNYCLSEARHCLIDREVQDKASEEFDNCVELGEYCYADCFDGFFNGDGY